jgi:hypothetical protein
VRPISDRKARRRGNGVRSEANIGQESKKKLPNVFSIEFDYFIYI